MLFARSERCHPRRVKRLKTQCLAGSQVVVCKIHQPPFLVPAALFPTISFYLLGVGLAIFLPIVRVRPAPLPWTLQDRKSTRLNSSHLVISYAVFCLKK